MNILYLAHRIPYPPDKGDKLRSFRQIEHLARRHRVWCAFFVDDAADEVHVATLSACCQGVLAVRLKRSTALARGVSGLLRGRSLTESYYANPRMSRGLERWASTVRFDAVVAFSSAMAPYALQIPAEARMLDMCDLDSQKWLDYAGMSTSPLMRRAYQTEGRRLAHREAEWAEAFDATLLITESEASMLRRGVDKLYREGEWAGGVKGRIHVVGNGVELGGTDGGRVGPVAKHAAPSASAHSVEAPQVPERPVVGFVGVMNYRPNADAVCWFVEACWGRIRAACPDAGFRIVGRSPTRKVRRLAAAPGVEVTGEVEDARAEVRRFAVSVAPMRIARGLQNKVLEAMAARKAVVLSAGAAEGLGGRDNEEYIVADTAEAFTRAVVGLLGDESERRRIGEAARRYVATSHCWKWELQRLEMILAGHLGSVSAPAETVRTIEHVPMFHNRMSASV